MRFATSQDRKVLVLGSFAVSTRKTVPSTNALGHRQSVGGIRCIARSHSASQSEDSWDVEERMLLSGHLQYTSSRCCQATTGFPGDTARPGLFGLLEPNSMNWEWLQQQAFISQS